MEITVFSRAGDCQAVKLLVAAKLFGVTATLRDLKDGQGLNLSSALSLTKIYVQLNGAVITEPNAAVVALAAGASASANAQLVRWLEWDATSLWPAVLAVGQRNGSPKLASVLQKLASSVTSSGWLDATSQGPSIADAAVYSSLLPLLRATTPGTKELLSAYKPVLDWAGRCAAAEPILAAEQQVLGAGAAEMLACWSEDVVSSAPPLLPQKGKRNILVTSALPYVNNVPHLGNIIGCVLSADCYARYCRARNYNIVYVCGTDEYGTATETKALEEGLTCAELCDKYYAIHEAVYRWFDIQFDKFGRTPSRWQTNICQSIFQSLKTQDNMQEQTMEQLYSEALGKFLADRFVVGTCPKCKYEDARGDQCDVCGSLLNPTELINPKCKITGTKPVLRSTKHLFLDLPKLSPVLQQYIDTTSALGGWSSNCVQVTAAWMRDGLKPRCITRDLKWGTPVPETGYEEKVFYVWFDAPIGYISITAGYTNDWEQWWKNPEDVEMVQFMGKDNVPFHTVIFPATLLGTGEKWTMMKSISVTEYLNYEGGKFSKSRGTGVFGTDAKDTGIPVEVWRYYLLSVRPEAQDTDFKWSDLQARNNSELLANLGNFINRALMFVSKFFDGKIPPAHETKGASEVADLAAAITPKVNEYIAAMEKIKIKEGIRLAMLISADGNKFIQDTKPWVVVKTDMEHCGTIVAAAVGLVRLLAALISPYMPSFSHKVLSQLAMPESVLDISDELVAACANPPSLGPPAGHTIGTPAPLVTTIPDDLIASLRDRYGGNQAEREAKAAAAATPVKSGGGAKAPKDAKEATPKEPKAPKEPKEPKEPKAPKAPKEPKEPKAPKEPKQAAPAADAPAN